MPNNFRDLTISSPVIELFEVDASNILADTFFYFTPAAPESAGNPDGIEFDSNFFEYWPVRADGFSVALEGVLPTPTVELANIDGFLMSVVMSLNGLTRAKVTRRRIQLEFLDSPENELPQDIYEVSRYTINQLSCVFYLKSFLDVGNRQIPRRRLVSLT